MPELILTPEPITQDIFKPFGDLIGAHGRLIKINEGTTDRFHKQAVVEIKAIETDAGIKGGQAIISMFRAQARQLPMSIDMMERHPLGSQAFLPTDSLPYLVLVCLGEKEPDPSSLKLFEVKNQGVNYHANCWHFPLLSLEPGNNTRDCWVVDRAGDGNNLEEKTFSKDWKVEIHLGQQDQVPSQQDIGAQDA